jgi:hypothetical protein
MVIAMLKYTQEGSRCYFDMGSSRKLLYRQYVSCNIPLNHDIAALLNTGETGRLVDQLVKTLSSDETEAACETECHVLIRDSTSVFQHMCPFLCHS